MVSWVLTLGVIIAWYVAYLAVGAVYVTVKKKRDAKNKNAQRRPSGRIIRVE